jgi:hypothetical protein
MCMADDSLGDVLENRYATEHVGGAFDAKHIPKPKSIEQAQDAATMGRKADESLMLQGLNTERYLWHDTILEEKPQQSLYGAKRGVEPKVAKPANTPLRSPVITKTFSDKGQGVRTDVATIPSVTPGGTSKRSSLTNVAVSGQNPRTNSVEPTTITAGGTVRRNNLISSATPGQGARTNSVIPRKITPSGNVGIVLGKSEPSGNGKPGVPGSRPFIPTPPRPFGPLIDLPVPIYWNTDPDMWDYTKLVGQTNWDS